MCSLHGGDHQHADPPFSKKKAKSDDKQPTLPSPALSSLLARKPPYQYQPLLAGLALGDGLKIAIAALAALPSGVGAGVIPGVWAGGAG